MNSNYLDHLRCELNTLNNEVKTIFETFNSTSPKVKENLNELNEKLTNLQHRIFCGYLDGYFEENAGLFHQIGTANFEILKLASQIDDLKPIWKTKILPLFQKFAIDLNNTKSILQSYTEMEVSKRQLLSPDEILQFLDIRSHQPGKRIREETKALISTFVARGGHITFIGDHSHYIHKNSVCIIDAGDYFSGDVLQFLTNRVQIKNIVKINPHLFLNKSSQQMDYICPPTINEIEGFQSKYPNWQSMKPIGTENLENRLIIKKGSVVDKEVQSLYKGIFSSPSEINVFASRTSTAYDYMERLIETNVSLANRKIIIFEISAGTPILENKTYMQYIEEKIAKWKSQIFITQPLVKSARNANTDA